LAGAVAAIVALAVMPALAPAKKKASCKHGKEHSGCRLDGEYKAIVGNDSVDLSTQPPQFHFYFIVRFSCGGQPTDGAVGEDAARKAYVGKTYHLTFPDSGPDASGVATSGTATLTITNAKQAKVTAHVNAHKDSLQCTSRDLSFTMKRVR
jgi:hypothetical protein